MGKDTVQIMRFDNLADYLLHKNGNYLYKVPFRGGWAVLKVYYGDQGKFRYIHKTYNNLFYNNKSSFMPRQRRLTELECLQLWREAGFRVFDTYDEVIVEGLPEGGYALFEYVEAQRFKEYFADTSVPLEERLQMWRRFLPVWHRRHALALERRETKLVHENGDLKHVLIMDSGEFLFFDFEMVFRSQNRIEEFVAREIIAYLKSLCNNVGRGEWAAFMQETINHYPDRALLDSIYTYSFNHPNPLLRFGRSMDRILKPRARKPFSKYNVALKLHTMKQALDQLSHFVEREGQLINYSKRGDGRHCTISLYDGDKPVLLKIYGLKRTGFRTGWRRVWRIFDVGQSSFQTNGRFQTEREVLDLWHRDGFDVPKILSPAFLSEFQQPCLAMEFIEGQSLGEVLKSNEVSLDHKKALITTFCQEMGRRHERALDCKEIRLLVFRPNVRGVLVSGDRLVYIDFETVYTPRRDLERIVRKEIAGFFYSLAKHAKEDRYALMKHFIAEYPSKTRMNSVLEELRQFGTVPFYRWQELFSQFFLFYKKYRRVKKGIKTFDAHSANGKHS